MKQDEIDEVQEIPEDRPKKVPRILPTSREEYYSSKRRAENRKIEYTPSTFSVNLFEEEETEKEQTPEKPHFEAVKKDESMTIWDIFTMIPICLTAFSFLWHLVWQEVFPLVHSIIDFLMVVYHVVWIWISSDKKELDSVQTAGMALCIFLEILMIGIYSDMSHWYLQFLFSIPLALLLVIVFAAILDKVDKKGKIMGFFMECLWFFVVVFGLFAGANHFRWIGFCQLLGIILTMLTPLVSDESPTKKEYILACLSATVALSVFFGVGE